MRRFDCMAMTWVLLTMTAWFAAADEQPFDEEKLLVCLAVKA